MAQISSKFIKDLAITTAKIAASAVTTAKIAADAVTEAKIRLSNNANMRARNAADSADVNILKVNASDKIEFASVPQVTSDPSAANDLARKSYVDGLANGVAWKAPVRAASTANVAIATGLEDTDTLDGVTLATGDRVLLKDQTDPAENGIYVVVASGAASRATDMDAWSEVPAAAVFVMEGTANGDKGFVCTSDAGGTLGTTAITMVQFSSTSITAGAGLTLTGSTIDVVAADSSLTVNANSIQVALATDGGLEVSSGLKIKSDTTTANTLAVTLTSNGAGVKYDANSFSESSEALTLASGVAGDGLVLTTGVLAVNTDGTTLEVNTDALRVKDLGISTAKLAAGAVTTAKIAADAVTGDKLHAYRTAITLTSTDITNEYADISGVLLDSDSVELFVDGVMQVNGTDYQISDQSGTTRIAFIGDLDPTGGAAALVENDVVHVRGVRLS
jgi:hypothetical protein